MLEFKRNKYLILIADFTDAHDDVQSAEFPTATSILRTNVVSSD